MRLTGQPLVVSLFGSYLFASQSLAISIEGRVVNSVTNEPVAEAELKLVCWFDDGRKRTPCKSNISEKTLADGTFRFDSLHPLRYRLTATGSRGLVATAASQIEADFSRGSASLTDVVLKLTPESSITGKVLDETGQPKADVAVEAFRQSISSSGSQVTLVSKAISNEKGVYVLHSLVAGNYYVSTLLSHEDKNDPTNPYLFFAPDALSLDQAAMTHVDTGQSYSDIDLHLRAVAFYRIQGRAQMETSGSIAADKPQLEVDARDNSGASLPGRRIPLSPDGTFQTDVLPGAYTLRLTGALTMPQPKNSQTPTGPAVHLLAKQDIDVSAKDLLGLIVLIPPPITVIGHAYLEGTTESNIGKGRVTLRPVEAGAISGSQSAEIQPDGTFVLSNCDPANYAVRFLPPSGTYVKSIVFNQQDAMTHLMDLSRGSGGELTIIVRPGAASVTGTLDSSASQDASESQKSFDVALISDLWDENGLVPVHHATSKDGHFSVSGLSPGHYSAVATTTVDMRLWDNVKFVHEMQTRGVGIDLAENDKKQLSVPYLAYSEIDLLQSRLGIN